MYDVNEKPNVKKQMARIRNYTNTLEILVERFLREKTEYDERMAIQAIERFKKRVDVLYKVIDPAYEFEERP